MTAADVQDPAAGATPAPAPRAALAPLRLAWLFAVSRRVPVAFGLLLALGALLWCALHWRWNIAGGPAAQEVIPLTVEAGSACIIAVSTYGPFGETEQATGRWLPYLRLGAALILSAAAFGALAAGGSAGALPGEQPACCCGTWPVSPAWACSPRPRWAGRSAGPARWPTCSSPRWR